MIIIIGDSWGVGEWGVDPITQHPCSLVGPGIGQLLMIHNQVVNLSVGNGSNAESLHRLETFLSKYRADESDTIYWIITCPMRGIDLNELIQQPQGITANIHSILDRLFSKADQLAQNNNIHIKLIGGLCDLDDIDINQYSNLEMCVVSWGKLLDDSYATSLLWDVDQLGKMVRAARPNLLPEWLDLANQVINKTRIMKMIPKYFVAAHPSRLAHRILRDHLYPDWQFAF
jgi:hypothetical protein